jgi:hypothetical protein
VRARVSHLPQDLVAHADAKQGLLAHQLLGVLHCVRCSRGITLQHITGTTEAQGMRLFKPLYLLNSSLSAHATAALYTTANSFIDAYSSLVFSPLRRVKQKDHPAAGQHSAQGQLKERLGQFKHLLTFH